MNSVGAGIRFVILINQELMGGGIRSQNSVDLLLNDKEFNEKSICFLTRESKLIECIQFADAEDVCRVIELKNSLKLIEFFLNTC